MRHTIFAENGPGTTVYEGKDILKALSIMVGREWDAVKTAEAGQVVVLYPARNLPGGLMEVKALTMRTRVRGEG